MSPKRRRVPRSRRRLPIVSCESKYPSNRNGLPKERLALAFGSREGTL